MFYVGVVMFLIAVVHLCKYRLTFSTALVLMSLMQPSTASV